jgi:diadenosine tetraphosphate (Ap4A) HIT family hydrolase
MAGQVALNIFLKLKQESLLCLLAGYCNKKIENGIFKDVEHYHMHVIPRYKDDGFSWVEPKITVNKDDFADLKTSLQDYLKHKVYFTSGQGERKKTD